MSLLQSFDPLTYHLYINSSSSYQFRRQNELQSTINIPLIYKLYSFQFIYLIKSSIYICQSQLLITIPYHLFQLNYNLLSLYIEPLSHIFNTATHPIPIFTPETNTNTSQNVVNYYSNIDQSRNGYGFPIDSITDHSLLTTEHYHNHRHLHNIPINPLLRQSSTIYYSSPPQSSSKPIDNYYSTH